MEGMLLVNVVIVHKDTVPHGVMVNVLGYMVPASEVSIAVSYGV